MSKFRVTLKYDASFTMVVDAEDEGIALEKVRKLAENDADLKQFNIGVEREANCDHIG